MPTLSRMDTQIIEADLSTAAHAEAVTSLINEYASHTMGQGKPLADDIRNRLVPSLRKHPTTRIFLAQQGGVFVGIAVCFTGFSTFAARPLLNIHDIFVRGDQRGRGVGTVLLAAVERAAKASGCCKLTLEVMDGNPSARAVYEKFGFTLGKEGEDAHRFMTKKL